MRGAAPGSVDDIAAMIRFCRRHDIKVATRGQAHTTFGQSLSFLLMGDGSKGQIYGW